VKAPHEEIALSGARILNGKFLVQKTKRVLDLPEKKPPLTSAGKTLKSSISD
jgi:hypothetical protein